DDLLIVEDADGDAGVADVDGEQQPGVGVIDPGIDRIADGVILGHGRLPDTPPCGRRSSYRARAVYRSCGRTGAPRPHGAHDLGRTSRTGVMKREMRRPKRVRTPHKSLDRPDRAVLQSAAFGSQGPLVAARRWPCRTLKNATRT